MRNTTSGLAVMVVLALVVLLQGMTAGCTSDSADEASETSGPDNRTWHKWSVEKIRESVDHGDAGRLRQLFQQFVAVGARYQAVDPQGQVACHVGRRLPRADSHLVRLQQDRMAAELGNTRFERHVGPERRLLEEHRKGSAL